MYKNKQRNSYPQKLSTMWTTQKKAVDKLYRAGK